MKKITILLFLISSFLFPNSLKLSSKDIFILKKIKSVTNDKQMQYTLMALCIKESSVGKFMISKTNDYGLFQANIKTVLSRQKVKDTRANRKYFANKLINDVAFSTANAIIELEYWQKVHKGKWGRTWASYNTGWRYKSPAGKRFASSVFKIIKKLKYEYRL